MSAEKHAFAADGCQHALVSRQERRAVKATVDKAVGQRGRFIRVKLNHSLKEALNRAEFRYSDKYGL